MNGIKTLAHAVLIQALEDLQSPHKFNRGNRTDIQATLQSAKEFLLIPDNFDLSFWCNLAEVDPEMIIAAGTKINEGTLDVEAIKKEVSTIFAAKQPVEEFDE
jgi:hypothetical protein